MPPGPHALEHSLAGANDSSDETLVRSALEGNESSFAELVQRHKSRVFGICARFTRSDADLDDLAQEVFIRAWRKLAQYRADAPFQNWLARIATHAAYDFLRRQKPPSVSLEECTIAIPRGDSAAFARESLAWAMSKLSPEERLVITLLELQDYTVREVADMTGWKEANVKVRAFRARQELKKHLTSIGESGRPA